MVFDHDSIESFLKDELRRRVRLNPRYSLRSYARHLKLSPGALSEILRGRRELSLKSVPNVAKAIGLNAHESRHLLRLAHHAKAARDKGLLEIERKAQLKDEYKVSEDIFGLISDWYHFAILNLLDCDSYQWSPTWIAKRLGISRIQAQMAMDLLLRMGLVEKTKGGVRSKNACVASPSEIPSAAVRNYHRQILEKAALALESQGLPEREFCGCGFAVDPTHLALIKKEIREFQDQLAAKYAKGKKTEVYFLEMALFKLTQGSQK